MKVYYRAQQVPKRLQGWARIARHITSILDGQIILEIGKSASKH